LYVCSQKPRKGPYVTVGNLKEKYDDDDDNNNDDDSANFLKKMTFRNVWSDPEFGQRRGLAIPIPAKEGSGTPFRITTF
jgi:hypothetical protein